MQTKQDQEKVLLEFEKKLKASGNGSLLFFRRAGIFLDHTPTLQDALLLYKTNYVEWQNLLDYVANNNIANADGEQQTEQAKTEAEKKADYKSMGIDLAGKAIDIIPDVIRASTGDNKTIVYKDERTEKKDNKTIIIIVSVVIAVVLVVAGIIYYNKRK